MHEILEAEKKTHSQCFQEKQNFGRKETLGAFSTWGLVNFNAQTKLLLLPMKLIEAQVLDVPKLLQQKLDPGLPAIAC